MASIWSDADRDDLVRRMWTLTPTHSANWGRLTVHGMLAHLNDAVRMATGDLVVGSNRRAPAFLQWPLVRYLVIHKLPMPKGAPTADELLARCDGAVLAGEQQHFATLFDGLPRRTTLAAVHPAFGPLTRHDWGALLHKHTDHHLRQFGV